MQLEIKKYPDPILRRKADEVKEITPEIKKLADDMIETMTKSQPDSVGLAAPQIGELKRIIVVQINKEPRVFVNPKIFKKSKEKDIMEEGCLSFPGLFLKKIKRSREVEVNTLDLKGKETQIKADGLFARVLQHEIDHLDGILFIDRLSFWQRAKLKLRL